MELKDIKNWFEKNNQGDIIPITEMRAIKVEEPMEMLPQKLDDLEKRIQGSLSVANLFLDDFDTLSRWLTKIESTVKDQKPLSADEDINSHQLNDQKYVINEVSEEEPKFKELFVLGEQLSDNDVKENPVLREKLTGIKDRWNKIKVQSFERNSALKKIKDLIEKFKSVSTNILSWLNKIENQCETLECITVDSVKLKKQEKDLLEIYDEFMNHKSIAVDVSDSAMQLIEKTASETEAVEKTANNVKERMQALQEKLNNSKHKVNKMKETTKEFDLKCESIGNLLSQVSASIEDSSPFVDDTAKREDYVDSLKDMLNQMVKKKSDVKDINRLGDDLLSIENKPSNIAFVYQITTPLLSKYDDLESKLKGKIAKVERSNSLIKNFNEKIAEVNKKSKPLVLRCGSLQTIGTTPNKIKEQLKEVEELQSDVQEASNLCNEAKMFANEMSTIYEKELAVEEFLESQLNLSKQPLHEMNESLDKREKTLKDQLKECGALQDQIDDLIRRVESINKRVTEQGMKPLSVKPGLLAVSLEVMEVSFFFYLFYIF